MHQGRTTEYRLPDSATQRIHAAYDWLSLEVAESRSTRTALWKMKCAR